MLNNEIPEAIKDRFLKCYESINSLKRLQWRKNYETMIPSLLVGAGRSFGELALRKDDVRVKKALARAASVLCRTNCKFAVMNKADYQSVLEIHDRRRVDYLKQFFKQIPFLALLPRKEINTLHLHTIRLTYQRGNVVCKEGEPSKKIFIIFKG